MKERRWVTRIWRLLFEHPLIRGIGIGLFGIIGNVLAGANAFDITKTDRKIGQFLDWKDTPHSPSFWALLAILVLWGLYTWGSARFEIKVRRATTAADIRERALEALLPSLLERAKRDIDDGKVTSLDEVMRMFEIENRRRK